MRQVSFKEQLWINICRHTHEILVNPLCFIAMLIMGLLIALQCSTFFTKVGKLNFFADIFGTVKEWVGWA
jgi:hypothetical protein